MNKYRITIGHTQKNLLKEADKTFELTCDHFEGFSMFTGKGAWRRKKLNTTTIEILHESRFYIDEFIEKLKKETNQKEVMLEIINEEVEFI